MKSVLMSILFVMLVGCGAPDPYQDLRGDWFSEISEDCVFGFSLTDDDKYVTQVMCFDDDFVSPTFTKAYSQIEGGRVEWKGDGKAVLIPKKSSCVERVSEVVSIIAINRNQNIVLTVDATSIILKPTTSGSGDYTGTVTYGCYEADRFVERQPF